MISYTAESGDTTAEGWAYCEYLWTRYVTIHVSVLKSVSHDNKGDAEFYGSPNSLYQFGAIKERYGYTYVSRSL